MTVPRRLLLAALLALSACSQPTAPRTSATTPTIGTPGPQQALVRLVLPDLRAISGQYLNPTRTTSLTVAVDSAASTTIAVSSLTCTASGCPVTLYVGAGAHTFTVKSYSAASVLISQGSQSMNVVLGQNNTLDLTLDPVNATYSLHSAVQQVDPATKVIGNYRRFPFVNGHSLVAFYDVLASDAVGDSIPAVLCGDAGVGITNISSASFPNRYRVELTTAGTHTLTLVTGSSCSTGSLLASQSVKTVNGSGTADGAYHSLALLADGTVRAWGYNVYGQLGNGTTTDSNVPVAVSNITSAVEVASGGFHGLALLADGTVRAWGFNTHGELGDGTNTDSSIPVLVSGITSANPAVEVAGGHVHSLALLADGTVRAWGQNFYGQLGNGTTTDSSVPVPVSGISTAVEVSGGQFQSLALLADGTVRAWGDNSAGGLGNGTNVNSTVPVAVNNITSAVEVASGGYHSLALLADGTVRAWGANARGGLGNGTNVNSNVPVQVSGISTAVEVSGGLYHSLALLADGTVRAWGYNYEGQLGNGSTTNSTTPVTVSGITAAVPTP